MGAIFISKPWWFRWCQSDIKFDLALVVSSLNTGIPVLRISIAWLLHNWIAWQLADWFLQEALKASDAGQWLCDDFMAGLHRLQGTSCFNASELTPWQYLWAKNETCCLEALRKSQDDQSQVFDFLWQCSLLVRDNVSAECGWAKITRQMIDAEGCSGDDIFWTRSECPIWLVVDFNRYGYSSINYNLGSQGALGESLAKFQHFTCIYFDLGSNNLGSIVPESWVSHRPPATDSRLLAESLSPDRWNSDSYERLETSYCLVLKKDFFWWRVYSSCWNFLFVRLIGPCSFEAVICLFVNICYWYDITQ